MGEGQVNPLPPRAPKARAFLAPLTGTDNVVKQKVQIMWVLTPAYGRDYTKKADAEADFRANKDFVCEATPNGPSFGGRYVNMSQIPKGDRVQIRYKRLTQLTVITC